MRFKTNNLAPEHFFDLILNHHFAWHEATRHVCKGNILNPRMEAPLVSNIIYMHTSAWQKHVSSFMFAGPRLTL